MSLNRLLIGLLIFAGARSATIDSEVLFDLDDLENQATVYLESITDALESHLQWSLDLHFRDMQKASLFDRIDMKYQEKEMGDFIKDITQQFWKFQYWNFKNETLKRQIEVISKKDYYILRLNTRDKMEETIEAGKAIGTELNICSYKDSSFCEIDHSLMLRKILKSKTMEELTYYWTEWRNKAGNEALPSLRLYFAFYSRASKHHGLSSPSKMFLYEFEDPDIFQKLWKAHQEIDGIYKELHAHVRYQLQQKYGLSIIPNGQPIPEDILEKFILHFNLENPDIDYPFEYDLKDLSAEMLHQNYTPTKLFEKADQFFTSMDFPTALNDDWKDYITLKEGKGCYPKAVTLFTKVGTGFYYCKDISFRNFKAVHSEMFKVHRDVQTKSLPLPYRVIMTEGFYEGLSKSVQLAVSSSAYLKKIGLIESATLEPQQRINLLYIRALRTLFDFKRGIAFASYYIKLLDSFNPQEISNCEYWKILQDIVGVRPPVTRSDADFDAIVMLGNGFQTSVVHNLLAQLLSFKLYDGLCKKSGKYTNNADDLLDDCDFSGSKEAGEALSNLIKLGSSKKWQELMSIITDNNSLDAAALLKYFEPLYEWLKKSNAENNIIVDWESSPDACK